MRQENKLRESADYQRVFQQNKSLRDRYWLILYRPNDLKIARLGMAVAKKNVKKAVQRNRIKRIIRETFRQKKHEIDALDIVVLVRQGICDKTNQDLVKAINTLWQKLGSENRQLEEKNNLVEK